MVPPAAAPAAAPLQAPVSGQVQRPAAAAQQHQEAITENSQESQGHQQDQQHAQASQAEHAAAMEEAFARSQAAEHAQWDIWVGVSLTVLLLLALPNSLRRQHWRVQMGAFAAEVGLRVVPAYLACLSRPWYLRWRTRIVTACRLGGILLPWLAMQSVQPGNTCWGGWLQFLLLTRALDVSATAWLARLPFKWFAWVHLIATVDAARSSLAPVCASPAFLGAAARKSFAAAARVGRMIAVLTPTPSRQPTEGGSCLDLELAGHSAGSGTSPGSAACACSQMAAWVLVCVGFGLPLACQYVCQAAAKRRFARRACTWRQCPSCATAKGTDLLTLSGTALLLFLGFCAVAWQLAGTVFTAPDTFASSVPVGQLVQDCAASL